MTQPPNPRLSSLFELEYPQSVGTYESYAQAQAAVDFLADAKFAVQNLAIVGTDLKSVERVTGRRNWGTVLVSGLQSGISTGLMVTFILWFLQPSTNPLVLLPGALLIGIVIGIVFSGISYASARGRRDFKSISQTVAARYEILSEHKVAAQARELLATMPGARAAQFEGRNVPAPWPGQQPAGPAGHRDPRGYGVPEAGHGQPRPGQGQVPYDGGHLPQGFGGAGQESGRTSSDGGPPVWGPASQPPASGSAPAAGDQDFGRGASSGSGYGNRPYGSYRAEDGIGQAPSLGTGLQGGNAGVSAFVEGATGTPGSGQGVEGSADASTASGQGVAGASTSGGADRDADRSAGAPASGEGAGGVAGEPASGGAGRSARGDD